jgi:hypothetical protein
MASPGRHPVSRWNSTSPRTNRFKNGSVASTVASSTGRTGSVSWPALRPLRSPATVESAWCTVAGTSCSDAAHLKIWTTRAVCRLTELRHHAASMNRCRIAFSASGPNVALRGAPVRLAQVSAHGPDVTGDVGRLPVRVAVVPVRVIEVGDEHLVKREPVRVGRVHEVRCGFEFGEEGAIRGFRLGGVEHAGEHLETTNPRRIGPDNASAAGRVTEVRGDGVFGACHGSGPFDGFVKQFHETRCLEPRPMTPRGSQKLRRQKELGRVGDTGFEPVTSSV